MIKRRFSKTRLARLHDVLARYVEEGALPGLVALTSRGDEEHVEVLGRLSFESPAKMRRDGIFRLSSMTKPITAVAALILVEECRLRLDDPVDALLPELSSRRVLRKLESNVDDTVPARRAITLRDLLTFRLGFGMLMAKADSLPIQRAMKEIGIGSGPPKPSMPMDSDEWIRRLGSLPLMHQPGEQWMYDMGSQVLGVLIARASGQSFDGFLRERVFEPLGMKDTGFYVPAGKIGRLATSYLVDPKTEALSIYDEGPGGDWSRPPAFPSGSSGLVSTIDDYASFVRMMMNRGKHGRSRLLSRRSIEVMTTDQLTDAQKAATHYLPGFFDDRGWGFGVSMIHRRTNLNGSVGSYGWDGGMGTTWSNDPSEDMIEILLTQRMWSSPETPAIARDFATLSHQAIDD